MILGWAITNHQRTPLCPLQPPPTCGVPRDTLAPRTAELFLVDPPAPHRGAGGGRLDVGAGDVLWPLNRREQATVACPTGVWGYSGRTEGGGRAHPPGHGAVATVTYTIPPGGCFFTGPWTVTCSFLRMLRWLAAFCRPLRPCSLWCRFRAGGESYLMCRTYCSV